MLQVSPNLLIPDNEIELTAIRAQGAGGQNVNKLSSAIHLRFDVNASSLPDAYKQGLLALHDRRISKDGVIVIKARRFRTQEKNRMEALDRLREIVRGAIVVRKPRHPTKPTKSSRKKRLDSKIRRGRTKLLRGRVNEE